MTSSRLAVLACTLLVVQPATARRATTTIVAPGELETAVSTASPGDTLELAPGLHPGGLEIAIRLRIVGRDGAVIAGDGRGTALTLAADGIEVSGLHVRGSGADLAKDDAGILIREVNGVTVSHCRIETPGFGIYLRAGGDHHIVDNVVIGDATLPQARRGNAIHLWYSQRNHIRGNELIAVRDGIYLSFAHDNQIDTNQGSGLRYGIHYMYSERNTLTANRFERSIGGLALMFSMENRIDRNVTVDNERFGILCQQLERSELEGNVAIGNGRGLYLQNSVGNSFRGNRVADNGVGAFLTAGSEGNLFTENSFEYNLVQVYQDHAADNTWAEHGRGNLWSDYLGVDWNGDGIGESPHRLETASSALLARHPSARWLWLSPLLGLLDWWQLRADLFEDRSANVDAYPLVSPPSGKAAAVESIPSERDDRDR